MTSSPARIVTIVALVAVVAVLAAAAARRVREAAGGEPLGPPPVVVRSAIVDDGEVEHWLVLEGRLLAAGAADVAPRVTAPVVARSVEAGDRVRRGDTLLVLEATRLEAEGAAAKAEVAAAEAQADAAERSLEAQDSATARDRRLLKVGAVSVEALEQSEARLAQASAAATAAARRVEALEAALAADRERLGDCRLTAPWDGAVVEVHLEPGDLATAGRPALRLVRDGGWTIEVRLPQEAAGTVGPGTPLELRHRGRTMVAAITRIAAGLDPAGLALAEAALDAPPFGLTDGASLGAAVAVGRARGLVVPAAALLSGAAGDFVFRLEDEVVRPVAIQVVLVTADRAVVAGPLAAGDRVVVEHPSRLMKLADGQRVALATGGAS
jgi:RND family efflux transporter MFP subunit